MGGVIVSSAVGIFLLMGGIFNFWFLNDPPRNMAFFYTHSFLRLFLSVPGMRVFNVVLGLCFLYIPVSYFIEIYSVA